MITYEGPKVIDEASFTTSFPNWEHNPPTEKLLSSI